MFPTTQWLWTQVRCHLQALRDATRSDVGATVVETVIIASALAALALSVMAAIKLLVDEKVAGISL